MDNGWSHIPHSSNMMLYHRHHTAIEASGSSQLDAIALIFINYNYDFLDHQFINNDV